ncbi:MAG: S-layer homology domain-containing protein, partial [Oscillospiraceae bacterium]|nr:S-layer homology domain-containing protein [Oscillospiraceae bacterium]
GTMYNSVNRLEVIFVPKKDLGPTQEYDEETHTYTAITGIEDDLDDSIEELQTHIREDNAELADKTLADALDEVWGYTSDKNWSVSFENGRAVSAVGLGDSPELDGFDQILSDYADSDIILTSASASFDVTTNLLTWINALGDAKIEAENDKSMYHETTRLYRTQEELDSEKAGVAAEANGEMHLTSGYDIYTFTDTSIHEGDSDFDGSYVIAVTFQSVPSQGLYSASATVCLAPEFSGFKEPESSAGGGDASLMDGDGYGENYHYDGYYSGSAECEFTNNGEMGTNFSSWFLSFWAGIGNLKNAIPKSAVNGVSSVSNYLGIGAIGFNLLNLIQRAQRDSNMYWDFKKLMSSPCYGKLGEADQKLAQKYFDEFKQISDYRYWLDVGSWFIAPMTMLAPKISEALAVEFATHGATYGLSAEACAAAGAGTTASAAMGWTLLAVAVAGGVLSMEALARREKEMVRCYNDNFNSIKALMRSRLRNDPDCNGKKGNGSYVYISDGKGDYFRVGHDPSGVVYEGVIENPVENAVVKLYYATDDGGNVIQQTTPGLAMKLSPAVNLRGQIPGEPQQTTGADGVYQWGVPEGLWYVEAVGPTGLTGSSGSDSQAIKTVTIGGTEYKMLPVLPPQLDVNIPLTDYTAPTVTEVKYTTEGVYVTFSKYMDEADVLNAGNYVLENSAGEPVSVTVSGVEQGHVPSNIDASEPTYTRTVLLASANGSQLSGDLNLLVRAGVKSYAGTSMESDYSEAGEAVSQTQLTQPVFSGVDSESADFSGSDVNKIVRGGTGVTLTSPEDASLYYTTDGTEPSSANGKLYSGVITVSNNMTVKAVAIKAGYKASQVSTGVFTTAFSAGGHTVSGRVDAYDGSSVDGLTLTLSGGAAKTTQVYNGSYSFSDVPDGSYIVSFAGNAAFAAASATVTVSGGSAAADFTLQKAVNNGGGGSGGVSSGGGSGPVTVPVSSDAGAVSVTANISGGEATIGELSDADVAKVVTKDEPQADVLFDLSGLGESIKTVSIPAETFKKVAKALDSHDGEDTITIKTAAGETVFDETAVKAIAGKADAGSVSLTFESIGADRLNTAQKDAFKGKELASVYELTLKVNGKVVTDFGGGRVTLKIKLSPKSGSGNYAVWYAASDGKTERMPGSYDGRELVFSTFHFSHYVVTYEDRPFKDVSSGDWYYDGVYYCYDNGYFKGVSDDTFAPGGTMTRAMFATVLYRMAGEPAVKGENPFKDVEVGQWYSDAVVWAAGEKIIEGYGGGVFGTNDPVTREQMVTIFWRYNGRPAGSAELSAFTDASSVSAWAETAVKWAVSSGVITGRSDGTLDPGGKAARAEVAQIVLNYETKAI